MEIAVARIATDGGVATSNAKKKHADMEEAQDRGVTVVLYYRRESASGQKTWVLIGKQACLPRRDENGSMVVGFREAARRELSKFKAPNFPLPSSLHLGCQLHVVVHAAGGSDDAATEGGRRPSNPHGGRILGEAKFFVKDLLKTDARQLSANVYTVNTQTKYGEVTSKTGTVVMRLPPREETRGWTTRLKTPGGQLSFETLAAMLKEEAKMKAQRTHALANSVGARRSTQRGTVFDALARAHDRRTNAAMNGATTRNGRKRRRRRRGTATAERPPKQRKSRSLTSGGESE